MGARALHGRRTAPRWRGDGSRRQHGSGLRLSQPAQDALGTTTIESKTNFFRGLRDGHIDATSRPLHTGRTTIVVETDVRDHHERLVARVLQTQLVLSG